MHSHRMDHSVEARQKVVQMTMLTILGRIHNHLAFHHGSAMANDVVDIKRCAVIGLSREMCNATVHELCALTCETPESVAMFIRAWDNVGDETRSYWRRIICLPYH